MATQVNQPHGNQPGDKQGDVDKTRPAQTATGSRPRENDNERGGQADRGLERPQR